jgi:hypothetical protein
MPTWDDVVSIGTQLPGVEAGTWWGTPGLLVSRGGKAKGKGFCRLRTDPDALVLRVADLDDREALLQGDPAVYFTTPHYESSPHILIRLDAIGRDELAGLIVEAWRLTAPRALIAARESDGHVR